MTYVYDAGTTDPNLAGLVEFGGVRINDGTFVAERLGGLIDSPPVRAGVSELPGDHGGYAGTPLYLPAEIAIEGFLSVPTLPDVWAAQEQLRGAFNLADPSLRLLVFATSGWSCRRQMLARVADKVVFNEPGSLLKQVPERDFLIPLVAPDPLQYDADLLRSVTLAYNGAAVLLPNAGTFPTYFTARFSGTVTDPALLDDADNSQQIQIIKNLTTYIDVQTSPVVGRSAISSTGGDHYGDIAAFTLGIIPPGGRLVRATGSSVGVGANVTITYRDAYV